MSTTLRLNTQTGRLERVSKEQAIRDFVPKPQSPASSPASTPVYTAPDGTTYMRDEKTKQSIPISSPAPRTTSSSRSSSRTSTTTTSQPEPQTPSPISSPATQSSVIRREPSGTIYINDPVRRQSRPLIDTSTPTTSKKTSEPPQEIRGTVTERLPDGSTILRPATEEEAKRQKRQSTWTGRARSAFTDTFLMRDNAQQLQAQFRSDTDTVFDFRPESVGFGLGTLAQAGTYILGTKGLGNLAVTGVTSVSQIPASIRATTTAVQTAQQTGTLTPFLIQSAKLQLGNLARGVAISTATGAGVLEVGRQIQKEETQALKELSRDEGFNIREEFKLIRAGTVDSMRGGGKKQQEAYYEQLLKNAESQGLQGEALMDYLKEGGAEFQRQTQFSAPWYKQVVFSLSGGQLFTGQDAFREQTRLRAQELNLTRQQTNIFLEGIEAERKSRGFAEIGSAIINTWSAEATGRAQSALTLQQFPVTVTSDRPVKGLFDVAKRTFLPVAFASGQEAFTTGISERVLRGENVQDFNFKELAQEIGISFTAGGFLGSGRAGLTAQRTIEGSITKPAKRAGFLTDLFVYTADPYEIVGDVAEESRQQILRKVFKRQILSPVVEFAEDAPRGSGRFRVRSVFNTPTTKTPSTSTTTPSQTNNLNIAQDGTIYINDRIKRQSRPLFNFKFETPRTETPKSDIFIPDPRIPDTKIPDMKVPNPKIPSPRIPDPFIPNPRLPSPRIPDPRIPDPKIPDVKVPDPRIPDPRIPDPRIPDPKIPDPRIPTLAFDWKMPPMFIPPLSLPAGSSGAGLGLGKRKKFVSELEQSQKLLGNLLSSSFKPQRIPTKKELKEKDKKKKRPKQDGYNVDIIFDKFFGGRR